MTTEEVVWSVGTSIAATALVAIVIVLFNKSRKYLTLGCPDISGEYVASYPEETKFRDETVHIKQFGPWIKGVIIDHANDLTNTFAGKVTPCRLFYYNFKSVDSTNHCCGTAMLKLSRCADKAIGHIVFMPEGKDNPDTVSVAFVKKKKR